VTAHPIIAVPYHLDEYLPGLDIPLRAGQVVAADLPPGDVWDRLAILYGAVAAAVADTAGNGQRPVVVSGDCTTALGTVAGLQRAGLSPGIVWLDAHGDVQTLETTASGYLGGLPLRLLAGYRPELIAARLGPRLVPEQQVLLVGARDLDPPELTYLETARIRRREVADLHTADLPDGPLYLHVDLDVIDPAEVPGLRFPAPGGPGPAQVASALRSLLATGRVAAAGIACTWYPGHGAAPRVRPHLEAALAAGD
jgi:arginase